MESEKAMGVLRPGREITERQGPLKVNNATKVDGGGGGGEMTSLRKDSPGCER